MSMHTEMFHEVGELKWHHEVKQSKMADFISTFSFPLSTPTEGSLSSYAHYATCKFLRHFIQT